MAAASASALTDPPYYVLVAHSQSLPASTSLSHPLIEYHYADDPPVSLLPRLAHEHVLVLDYDPARPGPPTVKSLSPDLVVSAVKVADAPGAAVAREPALRNNSMYVIETISMAKQAPDIPSPNGDDDEQSVHAVLSRFKQRNAVLRRILDYPNVHSVPPDSNANGLSPSTPFPPSVSPQT